MITRRLGTIGVLLLLLSQPRMAAAQAAPPAAPVRAAPVPLAESLKGEAKAEYEAARLLFGDEDFAGALVKFERAFEHSGDVRLLWNMAVCEKSLRHYVRVKRLLERYQNEGEMQMTFAQRDELLHVLQTVKTLVSAVRLTVDQPQAQVFVDDEPAGQTPLAQPLIVDLGTRRIRIAKPGFTDKVIVHDFAGNSESSFDVHLKPEPRDGTLAVDAQADASISVDGNFVGLGHWQGTLLAGEHMLHVSAPDKLSYRREVIVNVGEARRVNVELEAEPSGVSPLIWVGAGVLVAGGIATFTYFMLKPSGAPDTSNGSLPPFKIVVN